MSKVLRALLRGYDWFVGALAAVAAAIILLIALSVCVDVIARYAFRRPLGWPIDYSEYGLVAMTFLAMAWLVRQNGHVRIDLLLNALSDGPRRWVTALGNLVAAGICAACAHFAALTAMTQFARGSMTVSIHSAPRYVFSALIAVGLALTAIELARAAFTRSDGPR